MNSTWNLDPIYMGFDDPAFTSDLEALKKTVSDMTDLTAALGHRRAHRGPAPVCRPLGAERKACWQAGQLCQPSSGCRHQEPGGRFRHGPYHGRVFRYGRP